MLNPFDENALEAALRIKDVHDSKIIVISMGRNLSKTILAKSLATGADELVLLLDSVLGDLDSCATASTLATAIRKIGQYDLILTGREAADSNAGAVGLGIAEILGIPSVTIARKVEPNGGKLRVERVVSDGYEIVETPLPCLVTVSNELGELRSVNIRELVAAKKKPITTWTAQDLDVEPHNLRHTKLLRLYIPQKEVRCEIVVGETEDEAAKNLALKLREVGII